MGAIQIHGRLRCETTLESVGSEVAVVRRGGTQQQQFDALFGVGDPLCNPEKRYATRIGSGGNFSIDLPSFLSGDPIWIIPPLGTLVPLGRRADKQGLVFLLKTPEPRPQVYEINVRGDTASISVLKGKDWNFRKLNPSEQARIHVTVRTVITNVTANFSKRMREVEIDILE